MYMKNYGRGCNAGCKLKIAHARCQNVRHMIKKGQHDFSNFSNSSKTINCTSKLQEKSFYYLYL